MSRPAIEFRQVGKEYKTDFWKRRVRAVEEVTFAVGEGEIFGLIGPNGAGKTTCIKILMGLTRPTSGTALIGGRSALEPEAKRRIGYLPENAYYYEFLRTEEVIDFYGRLFGLSRRERSEKCKELLELVGLADRRGVRLQAYSKGMLQRIGIAQALVNDPDVVVFDEPMSGLDPIGRKEVRDVILRLKDRGKTIMFSSHILPDVEAICDRVAILVAGRVRAHGDMEELVRPRVKGVEVTWRGGELPEVPAGWQGDLELRRSGDRVVACLKDAARLSEILDWGRHRGWDLDSVVPQTETLEDIFMGQVETHK